MRAIVLCCALTLMASGAYGQAGSQPPGRDPAASAPQAKAKQGHRATRLDTSSLEKTIREVVKETGEKQDPHGDDHAKAEGQLVKYTGQLALDTNRLAEFTCWLVIATGVLALIAAGQLYMFRQQLRLMTDGVADAKTVANAAKDSADASVLSLRPWLSWQVEIVGPLKYDAQGKGSIALRCFVKNVGSTPARNVQLSFVQLTFSDPGLVPCLQQLAKKAKESDSKSFEPNQFGMILFPNDKHEFLEIGESIPISPTGGNPQFGIEVCGLVTYTHGLAKEIAKTGFNYIIRKGDGTILAVNEHVEPNNLRLNMHREGGHYYWGPTT